MYHFTIDGVPYSCDTPEELLAVAKHAFISGNGLEPSMTSIQRWSDRTRRKPRTSSPRQTSVKRVTRKKPTGKTTKKKTGTALGAKKSWAAAKKRAKAEGITIKEARSKIAAEKVG